MKIVLLCSLVAAAAAWPYFGDFQRDEPDGVPTAQKQHDINFLLHKLYEPLHEANLKALEDSFDPLAHTANMPDGGVAVNKLMQEVKTQHLEERHHWFSVFNATQREEALLLVKVLLQCQDWPTAIGNAVYFRKMMNEETYVYALYTAIKHSPLTKHVVLPPLYEIMPHFFTSSEVIQQAYRAKLIEKPGRFNMNFTGTQNNPEHKIAYFGEDIGLSTHYINWHIEYPFWWNETFGYQIERRGENYFWVHHQLVNRFEAERISNHLQKIEKLHWERNLHEGFDPHTSYKNGNPFPFRHDDIHIEDVDKVAEVRDMIVMENRIRDAIAHGYVIDKEGNKVDINNEHGIDILGDIIESCVYNPYNEYYGSLHNMGHMMLGHQGDPHAKYYDTPSVLEHYETALRDPAFYKLHKYIDDLFRKHKDHLKPYTQEDLLFPGVAVNMIDIDGPLETYFEDYEYSLMNAMDDKEEMIWEDNMEISAIIPRLNHRDFSFKLGIVNNNDEKKLSTIRIFAWPHRDVNGVLMPFNEGRWHAIELDKFQKELIPGENTITRKSSESSVTVPDVPSLKSLHEQTEAAIAGSSELNLDEFVSATGLPNRLLIPKGNEAGVEFKLVVAVTDGVADSVNDEINLTTKFHHYGHHGVYLDKKPHGYPLDRRVPDERLFHEIPNFGETIVKVSNHDEHVYHH
ncbi:Pseudohemocyanin-2-like 2 [Homarus americanus]|uniref:Pseudohemocyanin-2-like 2 n=1 Tax=Homarus americanus TaxID=6706 RepID=A0A8J5TC69_HOMAM|nr:Pseudohemocyanin-2-like 2 [Homarus americanus]